MWFDHQGLFPKEAGQIVNSQEPDQTVPLSILHYLQPTCRA